MTDYIERQGLLELYTTDDLPEREGGYAVPVDVVRQNILDQPAADVVEIVRCKDCQFWRDRYIKTNDGRERKYTDQDIDGLGLNMVTASVGINMSAMCRVEDNRGWGIDKSVFRNEDDFCSRGQKRPCSYDEWWGIKDGFYPTEMHERVSEE